jgi:hypothetical protein
MAQPVYVPPPVAVPGAIPIYPHAYPGVYPYSVVVPNPVVVLPPGYRRVYGFGYSPWGDLADDLDSLF